MRCGPLLADASHANAFETLYFRALTQLRGEVTKMRTMLPDPTGRLQPPVPWFPSVKHCTNFSASLCLFVTSRGVVDRSPPPTLQQALGLFGYSAERVRGSPLHREENQSILPWSSLTRT